MTHLTALARQSLAGLVVLLALTAVLGVAYPLAITGVAELAGDRAHGQLLHADGRVVGSREIGQSFDGEGWFRSRPSAAGDGYDGMASAASNLGPNDPGLLATVRERRAAVAAAEGADPADVPADAVTASGSGLDPDISPGYALLQVPRVARERELDEDEVRRLVDQHVLGRTLGFLGEPRVNVLELNLALQHLASPSGG